MGESPSTQTFVGSSSHRRCVAWSRHRISRFQPGCARSTMVGRCHRRSESLWAASRNSWLLIVLYVRRNHRSAFLCSSPGMPWNSSVRCTVKCLWLFAQADAVAVLLAPAGPVSNITLRGSNESAPSLRCLLALYDSGDAWRRPLTNSTSVRIIEGVTPPRVPAPDTGQWYRMRQFGTVLRKIAVPPRTNRPGLAMNPGVP